MKTKNALLSLLLLGCALPGQAADPAPGNDTITASLQAFLAGVTKESTPQEVARAAEPLAAALSGKVEQPAVQSLIEALQGADGWDAVRERHADRLLDLYRRHRTARNPHRLAPLVVVLERLAPERPQVQLGVAEVFGGIWAARDVVRAAQALDSFAALMPKQGDGLIDGTAKIAGFVGLAGDVVAGWRGLVTLVGYISQLSSSVKQGAAVRVLTADDLVAFQVLADLGDVRGSGDQASATRLLEELRSLQPRNPVYPLLLAESHASLGPKWQEAAAKKCIREFLDMTDPRSVAPADGDPWMGWTDVSTLLRMLRWTPAIGEEEWRTMSDLRAYAKRLEGAIKPSTDERLVISPDREELRQQIARLERGLPKLERERDEKQQKIRELERDCKAAEAAYRNVPSGAGGYQQHRSDLHSKWADLKRQLDQAKSPTKRAEERYDRSAQRLAFYQQRMRQFDN